MTDYAVFTSDIPPLPSVKETDACPSPALADSLVVPIPFPIETCLSYQTPARDCFVLWCHTHLSLRRGRLAGMLGTRLELPEKPFPLLRCKLSYFLSPGKERLVPPSPSTPSRPFMRAIVQKDTPNPNGYSRPRQLPTGSRC